MTDILEREHEPLESGQEHKPLNFKNHSRLKAHLGSQPLNWKNACMLGLHHTSEGICPGNFIGMVWIGKEDCRTVLRVHSKFPQMDYIKMLAECCAHPDIGSRMDGCFKCWPEKEYIDASTSPDFLSIIIISFLHALNQLCVRHLRKNFERRRENFTGKVKGKIDVSENMRQNIVRGRLDRVFCEYQSFSDDILENRILRAALERAAWYVARNNIVKKYPASQRWIHACRSHLQSVSVMPVSRSHFAAARKRGIFAFYRHPLHLAKAVLLNLGFDPHEETSPDMKMPPYAINSAELFERYAELQLRKTFPASTVHAHSEIRGSGDYPVVVKPDFYVPKGEEMPRIIDAKYKDLFKGEKPSNSDIYQVIAYFQHKGMLEKLKCSEGDDVRLSLVYPLMDDSKQWPADADKTIEEFDFKRSLIVECRARKSFVTNFHIDRILCPIKEEEND